MTFTCQRQFSFFAKEDCFFELPLGRFMVSPGPQFKETVYKL